MGALARRYGEWTGLVRTLAAHDPDVARRILRWPLDEALLAYRARARETALTAWRMQRLEWALLAPWTKDPGDPPKKPAILLMEDVDGG